MTVSETESIAASIEDEDICKEEEQAVIRSKEWFVHNQGIAFKQIVEDLGFTMEQVRSQRLGDEREEPET